MTIRRAGIDDCLWLREHDDISEKVLELKIRNGEVYVVRDDEKTAGWLRSNLFWDNVPFMTHLYLVEIGGFKYPNDPYEIIFYKEI
jgi:hypothetical protein